MTSGPSRRSPLHEVHGRLGASFTDFAGWSMPLRYSSELAEHKSVREAAGLFDLSHMAEIEITGTEAAAALDYAVVGNLSGLAVGRARYTMLCNSQGGVLDDLVVYRLAEQRFLVVANAANAAVVLAELQERSTPYSAEVVDRSADLALIAVQGPKSVEILRAVLDQDPDSLKYYASMSAVLTSGTSLGSSTEMSPGSEERYELLLARTGYTGEDGFELYASAAEAPAVWEIVTEAGASQGLQPAGLACRDTLRLEAGMPLYGNELSTQTTPFEAHLGRIVKFEKPDFVGRAALADRQEKGVEQSLVGLRGEGRRAPRHGYRVLSEDAEVGHVTSGALSPTLGYPIAMAYVSPGLAKPGSRLMVDIRGRVEPVEVVDLPFYVRPKVS